MLRFHKFFLIAIPCIFSACSFNKGGERRDIAATISGVAQLGPIKNAEVEVQCEDSQETLGSATTDANGNYRVELSTLPSCVVILTLTGGEYVEESSGITITVPSTTEIRSLVGEVSSGAITASITPLTEMAVRRFQSLKQAYSELPTEQAQKLVEYAKEEVRLAAGLPESCDIVSTLPSSPTSPNADKDSDENKMALFLAGLSQLAASQSTNSLTIMDTFAEDMEDGSIAGTSWNQVDDQITVWIAGPQNGGKFQAPTSPTIPVSSPSVSTGDYPLPAEAYSKAATLTLSDSPQLNFPYTAIGNSVDGTITITNSGEGSATDILGSGLNSPFQFKGGTFPGTGGTCTAVLSAGSSCTLILSFAPTTAGSASDGLVISYRSGPTVVTVNRTLASYGLGVEPIYPNLANWMSYTKFLDSSKDRNHQQESVCLGTESGNWAKNCIHGGERRKVVTTETSCTGLSIADDLGVFNWHCEVDNGLATFFMDGMKESKGLKDLLNATSWKNNFVVIQKNGSLHFQSNASAWWTNSIYELPDNSADSAVELTLPGIYTLTSSRTTPGYLIKSSNVGVVTLGDAVLSWNGSASNNCDNVTGEITGADDRCILTGTALKNFLWIEGRFDGYHASTSAEIGIQLIQNKFSVVRNSRVSNVNLHGVRLRRVASSNLLLGLEVANAVTSGVLIESNTAGYESDSNTLHRLKVFNSGTGVHFSARTRENTATSLLLANNNYGLRMDNNTTLRNTITHISSLNSATDGINFNGGSSAGYATFNNILSANSTVNNIHLQIGGSNLKFNKTAAVNAGDYGIDAGGAGSNNSFQGFLVLGQNATANCSNSGTGSGVLDVTCTTTGADGSSTYTGHSSNAVLRTSRDISSAFNAKATTDDSSNTSDSLGSATFSPLLDWFSFDNPYRTWGSDGGTYASDTNNGRCTSGTCRIWEWILKSTATQFYNVSGNGNSQNTTFTNGAACPSELDGSVVTTDQQTEAQTFLSNAYEIVGDSFGDEDGLCESKESCVYTPHLGHYQGQGDYRTKTCLFTNGTITDVTVYDYPTD